MPTGYTAKIYDGKEESLEDFILHCSRALGAYMHQRDEFGGDKPSKQVASDYYPKALRQAEKELGDLLMWTSEDKAGKYADESAKHVDSHIQSLKRAREMADRYNKREIEILSIDWPKDDENTGGFFKGLKKFILEQLDDGRKFDVHESKFISYDELHGGIDGWFEFKVSSAKRDIAYYTEKRDGEIARVAQQNLITDRLYEFVDSL